MQKKQILLIIETVLLVLTFSTSNLVGAIKKGPYLMLNGNSTQMTVLWQTNIKQACVLEWGTTTTYGNKVKTFEYNSEHQHKYVISGLTNNKKYYYRIIINDMYYTGSFCSAPASSAARTRFFVFGDTRSYPASTNKVEGKMIDIYTANPKFQTIALFVGDYAFYNSESSWASEFFPRKQENLLKFQSEVPIMPCRGNHEKTGDMLAKYYPYPYKDNFYYSFNYGPVHVAVIDQNPSSIPKISSAQLNWLNNDLATTTKRWKIIILHSPGWSAGSHENDPQVQIDIQPICVKYGVSFVFCGDNHYYARAIVDGINHVTTGGGGAPLYTPNPGYPYIVATKDTYEFCEVDIRGNILYFRAIDYLGNIIDAVTIKHAARAPFL